MERPALTPLNCGREAITVVGEETLQAISIFYEMIFLELDDFSFLSS
jgi:hypothetical protein